MHEMVIASASGVAKSCLGQWQVYLDIELVMLANWLQNGAMPQGFKN